MYNTDSVKMKSKIYYVTSFYTSFTKFKIVSLFHSGSQNEGIKEGGKGKVRHCWMLSEITTRKINILVSSPLSVWRGIQRYPAKISLGLRYSIRTRVTNNEEFLRNVLDFVTSNKWKQRETQADTENRVKSGIKGKVGRENDWMISSFDTAISSSRQQFYKRYFFMRSNNADSTQFNQFTGLSPMRTKI